MQSYMTFLQKLQKAINDEWAAAHFYKNLRNDTTDPVFREFIDHPLVDEVKHYKLFQELHCLLTGTFHEVEKKEVNYRSFEEGVLIAMKNELEAAEFYREMLFEIPIQEGYYPLFIAMTDEMEHSTRFGTIYGRLK